MSNQSNKLKISETVVSREYLDNNCPWIVRSIAKPRANFGGMFDEVTAGMYITKVIYSNPATIVFWSDGTKTTSKVQKGDTYSKETGLTICILKKLVGGEQVAQLFKDWIVEENYVDLKAIREKHRSKKCKGQNA